MERRANLAAAPTRYSDGLVRRHKPDYWLLIFGSLLVTIGLIVVYSISPGLSASQHISQSYFVTKQLIDVALGITTFLFAAYVPVKFWERAAKPLAVAALAGSLIVLVMPVDEIYQAHRWIRLGGFSFQVAELIKLAILIGLAQFLAWRYKQGTIADFKAALKPLIILLLAVGVVVAKLQSDLGSAGVMVMMMLVMAYVAGFP
jgi:cell division protein FtsW